MSDETATGGDGHDRVEAYAHSVFEVARAEGAIGTVSDQLFRFARALETNDALRAALGDAHVAPAKRQQVVEDLLEGRAHEAVLAVVSMIVAVGRANRLPAIIDRFVAIAAESLSKAVAEVRTPVELTEQQKARLAEAISAATGKQVDLKVVIDPSVMGGIVTTVGDTVIDGSIRTRLEQLKQAI